MRITIRGLYSPPRTYDGTPDEARAAYHAQFPGFAGTILEVIEEKQAEE